ncbi:MAG: hypothetical protein JKY67_06415 [Pseudomonadales bacterium]|nr:hypothetical protein [Pseudomonadales bacterium]
MRGILHFFKLNLFAALAAVPVAIPVAIPLAIIMVVPLVFAEQAVFAEQGVFSEQIERSDQKKTLIKEVLTESGLMAIVETAAYIRDEEMSRLAATKGPITESELAAVRIRLMGSVREKYILNQIRQHLDQEFLALDLQKLLRKLRVPAIEKAKLIKGRISEAHFAEEIRDYHLRLIEHPPRESRVQLMSELAKVERINGLNTIVKVEVRKSLLTAITHVKDNVIPTEQELDRQMTSFRKRVADKSNNQSVEHYLYLFRAVPSSELKNIINDYKRSGLQRLVDSCEKRLKKEFSVGRQQFDQVNQIGGAALAKRK